MVYGLDYFVMCKDKDNCRFSDECRFAHSEAELAAWNAGLEGSFTKSLLMNQDDLCLSPITEGFNFTTDSTC